MEGRWRWGVSGWCNVRPVRRLGWHPQRQPARSKCPGRAGGRAWAGAVPRHTARDVAVVVVRSVRAPPYSLLCPSVQPASQRARFSWPGVIDVSCAIVVVVYGRACVGTCMDYMPFLNLLVLLLCMGC